jgi:hypothetical protein
MEPILHSLRIYRQCGSFSHGGGWILSPHPGTLALAMWLALTNGWWWTWLMEGWNVLIGLALFLSSCPQQENIPQRAHWPQESVTCGAGLTPVAARGYASTTLTKTTCLTDPGERTKCIVACQWMLGCFVTWHYCGNSWLIHVIMIMVL